jgi:hypothetical protein
MYITYGVITLDIFNIIDSAKNKTSYAKMDSSKHMITLKTMDFGFVYRELKFKSTFHYIDSSDHVSFLIKITSAKDIEVIMKSRKTVSVIREIDGPGVELIIEGVEKRFIFPFELDNPNHLYELKKLIESREIYLYFILYSQEQCVQCFSALLGVDDRILERLIYMIKLTSLGEYPRVEFESIRDELTEFIKLKGDSKVLEDVLDITEMLQKWGSKDRFIVYIDYDGDYKVFINGNIQNMKYIKKELLRKYELIEEGIVDVPTGKAFFKYDKGMIYYFKSNVTLLNEVKKYS